MTTKPLKDLTLPELLKALEDEIPGAETEFTIRDWLMRNPKSTRESVEPSFSGKILP